MHVASRRSQQTFFLMYRLDTDESSVGLDHSVGDKSCNFETPRSRLSSSSHDQINHMHRHQAQTACLSQQLHWKQLDNTHRARKFNLMPLPATRRSDETVQGHYQSLTTRFSCWKFGEHFHCTHCTGWETCIDTLSQRRSKR